MMRQNESELLVKFELLFSKVSGNVQTPLNVSVNEMCQHRRRG